MQAGGGRRGGGLPDVLLPQKKMFSVKKMNSASRGFLASCSRVKTACGVVSTGEGREKNYMYVYTYLGIS